MRYFVHLSYDGTGYCGWQLQPNGDTVQGQMNFALSRLLNERVSSMGCGRTDSGVHASDFYMHFDTERVLDERFTFRLNSLLPHDISVHRIIPVHQNAHTRFDAVSRTYEYYIHFDKNPFLRHYSYQVHYRELDWDRAIAAAALVPSFGDYTSLCRPSEDFKTNLCQVTEARWDKVIRPAISGAGQYEFMRFTITSNRFLRGMVRIIVGTMVQIARGGLSIDDFRTTVEAKADFRFAISSPPQGLYLTRVVYPYIEPMETH